MAENQARILDQKAGLNSKSGDDITNECAGLEIREEEHTGEHTEMKNQTSDLTAQKLATANAGKL